ncbi:MAG TPA: gamma-glutamylcyclotransferase [Gammaproteobacteria bacterium]|nr:gamma-glutamylcyclotransferase [Gammaproteobacteria bacterium]
MPKVFVYGTLLKRMSRSSVLDNSLYYGLAIIEADLYNLGSYPGIKQGDGCVVGEIYEVSQQTGKELDEIEGYDFHYHQDSLFIREEVEACSLSYGAKIDCYVYCYNGDFYNAKIIQHGDYRRFLMEKDSSSKQWIISYGSNMSSGRIAERVGEVTHSQTGYLDDFELVFNKKAFQHDSARANIRCNEGIRCPAVAWELSKEQINQLDRYEGTPSHYMRIALPFITRNGLLPAQGYIAHPSRLMEGLTIEPTYWEHIREGYEEHGFQEHVMALRERQPASGFETQGSVL